MDNTFFYWDDIYEEKDRYYSSIVSFGEQISEEDDYECDYNCDSCWCDPEDCGRKGER